MPKFLPFAGTVLYFLLSIGILVTNAQNNSEPKIWESWERVADLPFSMRDGVGVVHFKDELWMMGGWKYGPLTNSVYKSSDALNWEKVTNAPWNGRHGAGMVSFKGKLWVISGDGHTGVWSSEDGINWVQEVTRGPWGKRYTPYILVYNDKIWLMGGVTYWDENDDYHQNNEYAFNDVWSSTDGVNWTLECESAPWGGRGLIHGSAVFKDEMWIIGGGSKWWNIPTNIFNDVWKSKDGVNWELVTNNAGWEPRIHFSTIAFDNKLWVIDGTTVSEALTNEVWYSEDGADWKKLNSVTNFPATHASTVFTYNDALYIGAGYNIDAIYRFTPPKAQIPSLSSFPNGEIGVDTLIHNFSLSSNLNAKFSIADTSIAQILTNNKFLIKKLGETKISVWQPGDYGFYPLDTLVYDFSVLKKKQQINIDVHLVNAFISDTIKVNAYATSGLPVKIIPNSNIILTSDSKFIPKKTGYITVELLQEGNHLYDASSLKMDLYVDGPKQYTIYPNPANDFIRVLTEENIKVDQFIISNFLGENIVVIPGKPEKMGFFDLDIHNLPPGIYLLNINSNNKSSTHKFIKK